MFILKYYSCGNYFYIRYYTAIEVTVNSFYAVLKTHHRVKESQNASLCSKVTKQVPVTQIITDASYIGKAFQFSL